VRAVRGGGPGGPLPFRIYVDSGVVLLCLHALAPASPLVAPFSFLYFLISTPMLRRNVIFMYRPRFDGGGIRWPFLFDMSVSCMFVGQILLATMLMLKKSFAPALLAGFAFVPTLLFRDSMRQRFLRAFSDVALLQTSLLDGWATDPDQALTFAQREEFRRFLVDSHKAAYLPVCIAGTRTDEVLTAEPAVVVPTMNESELENQNATNPRTEMQAPILPRERHERHNSHDSFESASRLNKRKQFGATLRRASTLFIGGALASPHSMEHLNLPLDLSVSDCSEKEKQK
jgi:hypothetical protein